MLGTDPEANAALEAVALDSLRDATVRDRVIQPGLFKTWVRRYGSLLDFLAANNDALVRLFNKGHLKALNQIAAARGRDCHAGA